MTLPISGIMDVRLLQAKLWREFHDLENEMIIVKGGRQLFPCLEYKFYNLEPKTMYHCSLTFTVMDDKKYRFMNSMWEGHTSMEPTYHPREVFIGKPKTGSELMRKGLSCEKIKITNAEDKTTEKNELVRVQSMRKYMPVLSVYRLTNDPMCPMVMLGQYKYPETQFIAVTAYQRDTVKKHKVEKNKYAQGHRDQGSNKRTSTSPLLSGTPSCSSDDSPQSRKSGMTTPANDENIGGMDQLQMQQQIQIQQQQQQMMMMNPFGVVQQQQQQYQTNNPMALQPHNHQQGYFNNNQNMPMYTPQYGFDMQQYNYDQFYNPAWMTNWGSANFGAAANTDANN